MKDLKVYRFGATTDGNASMKNELGGKGANLAEMSLLGIPVPPGFTIPCEASILFAKGELPLGAIRDLVSQGADQLYKEDPMALLSVRSGARVSMPGMMDTILNVGICDENLSKFSGLMGERAALDCYRRLIQMMSSVALGVPHDGFEEILHTVKESQGVQNDSELSTDSLKRLISSYFKHVAHHGVKFPQTQKDQLVTATVAVFESWNNPRAIEYRKMNGYSDDWGTAVTIQKMVFGNAGDDSCTGVVFTRCPSTGEKLMTGEFLVNAQGEDVVAGIRTPQPLNKLWDWDEELGDQLEGHLLTLEKHFKDMQDVEFTVDKSTLYILQTRNAKRAPTAAIKVAHDLAEDGFITKQEAVSRVSAKQFFVAMADRIDPKFTEPPHFTGIAAGGGLVHGEASFSSEKAASNPKDTVLISTETSPDDIVGMNASVGILTATGGLTSHAAVVARGMNKSCVVGCTAMKVSGEVATITTSSGATMYIKEGERVTLDGATGGVWIGLEVPVIPGGLSPEAAALSDWARPEDCIPRLTLTPQMTGAEVLSLVQAAKPCGMLFVDTALLDGVYPPSFDADALRLLERALLDTPEVSVILDLNTTKLPAFVKCYFLMLTVAQAPDVPEVRG